jgi:hypothetical protein
VHTQKLITRCLAGLKLHEARVRARTFYSPPCRLESFGSFGMVAASVVLEKHRVIDEEWHSQ